MVSSTQQSSRIRRRKQSTNGKVNKRVRRANGTPAFPIHLDGAPAAAAATTAAKPAAAARPAAAAKPAAAKPAAKPAAATK